MAYSAVPDMRMPYDNDGSIVGQYPTGGAWAYGIAYWLTNGQMLGLNNEDLSSSGYQASNNGYLDTWILFPESREVTAFVMLWNGTVGSSADSGQMGGPALQGSTDSTNGVDGTWETPSLSGGFNDWQNAYTWREQIRPCSFTGPKKWLRHYVYGTNGNPGWIMSTWHIYGEKAAGQTPDDVIFIDHDDTPGVEFTAVEDYGNQALGTTVVRQFRIKNTSATKTANTINIQCNDSDFSISENGTSWVVTINIASLAAGAESATLYSRCVTPAPGGLLGPRAARIVVTVASYT